MNRYGIVSVDCRKPDAALQPANAVRVGDALSEEQVAVDRARFAVGDPCGKLAR